MDLPVFNFQGVAGLIRRRIGAIGNWHLYQYWEMIPNGAYFHRYSMLGTWGLPPNFQLHNLQTQCSTVGILSPIDAMEVDGALGLLYVPFRTLAEYRDSAGTTNSTYFAPVIKNAITKVLLLHERQWRAWNIPHGACIVETCGGGSLVQPVFYAVERSSDKVDDFTSMATYMEAQFTNYLGDVRLRTLIKCMKLADSFNRQRRLLQSPFFHTGVRDKWDFIAKVNDGLHHSDPYKKALGQIQVDLWRNIVTSSYCGDLHAIFNRDAAGSPNNTPYSQTPHCHSFLRFLRNYKEHRSENRRKLLIVQNTVAAHLMQLPPPWMPLQPDQLVAQIQNFGINSVDAQIFLEIVVGRSLGVDPYKSEDALDRDFFRDLTQAYPKFLDELFEMTYAANVMDLSPGFDEN